MQSTQYRHKPKLVDAVEGAKLLAAAANGSMDLAPKWVKDAIWEKRLEVVAVRNALVCYPLPGVPRVGSARDWVLHDPIDNTINVIPPEVLAQLYDEV
jgi:hypothetical protein